MCVLFLVFEVKSIYKGTFIVSQAEVNSLGYVDMERGARNMLVTPFDDENIVTAVQNGISYIIVFIAQMLDQDFFAWGLWSADANH